MNERETDFWHTANLAFRQRERLAFNRWRGELYGVGDRLRDTARVLPDDAAGNHVRALVNDLLGRLSEVPILGE